MEKTKSEVLTEYFNKYAKDLFRSAYAAVGDKFDAEVIIQDTFLTAAEKYDSFIECSNPRGWLQKTMTNMIKRLYYERKRVQDFVPYDENESPHGTLDEHSVFLEYQGIIPDDQLRLVVDFHCDRYSCDDLSKKNDLTVTNTRVKLCRGRAKFREEYWKEMEKIK